MSNGGDGRTWAEQWLGECGVTRVGDGWVDRDAPGDALAELDLVQTWAGPALEDADLDPAERLRLGFGLLDLFGLWWVTVEMRFVLMGEDNPLPVDAFWAGYRERLEAVESTGVVEAVTYSLWVDWFEDRATVDAAFAQVLGDSAGQLKGGDEPLLRRARRVLEVSGPVPWALKHPVYRIAAGIPELQGALFRGILTSYRDVYGDLEPGPALELLQGLDLPADTEHLGKLRAVLEAGHVNHHRSPDAWQ
ncbi:hypothetical protein [Streptomyces sp. NBC_01465]|uniref:hypothetical protein n=1 Tax=Streptomyces sp. NBC_01465 TaxID=2903878 RepID=UPI002E342C4B|nr:hypothetical protein [Streptomyces sp. NBC_01465]